MTKKLKDAQDRATVIEKDFRTLSTEDWCEHYDASDFLRLRGDHYTGSAAVIAVPRSGLLICPSPLEMLGRFAHAPGVPRDASATVSRLETEALHSTSCSGRLRPEALETRSRCGGGS